MPKASKRQALSQTPMQTLIQPKTPPGVPGPISVIRIRHIMEYLYGPGTGAGSMATLARLHIQLNLQVYSHR